VWIELAREKHAGGLQDLVCATQLRDLFAQRFDLLALLAAQDVFAPALISFGLPNVFAKRLALDPEIPRDMRDRTPRLEHQARTALQQLLGILPELCHGQRLLLPPGQPWHRSLR
jgi:hypothetical protein